jgi:Zn-dependent protease
VLIEKVVREILEKGLIAEYVALHTFLSIVRMILGILLPFALIYMLYTPTDLKRDYVNALATLCVSILIAIPLGDTLGHVIGALVSGLSMKAAYSLMIVNLDPMKIPAGIHTILVKLPYTVFICFGAATIAYLRRRS